MWYGLKSWSLLCGCRLLGCSHTPPLVQLPALQETGSGHRHQLMPLPDLGQTHPPTRIDTPTAQTEARLGIGCTSQVDPWAVLGQRKKTHLSAPVAKSLKSRAGVPAHQEGDMGRPGLMPLSIPATKPSPYSTEHWCCENSFVRLMMWSGPRYHSYLKKKRSCAHVPLSDTLCGMTQRGCSLSKIKKNNNPKYAHLIGPSTQQEEDRGSILFPLPSPKLSCWAQRLLTLVVQIFTCKARGAPATPKLKKSMHSWIGY